MQEAVNGAPKLALILFEPRVYSSSWQVPSGSLPEGVELDFQALGKETISVRQGRQAEASSVHRRVNVPSFFVCLEGMLTLFIRHSQQTVE